MFGRVTFRNSCFTVKLLDKSLDITRILSHREKHGCEHFSKSLPKLVYLHNPLTYLWTQFQLARLRILWDREFERNEFFRGAKQAAVVMTDCIREQDQMTIGHLTTPVGYQQITRDMNLSRKDARLQLVRFRFEDMHRSVPVKVVLLRRGSYKNCFIDILFVGMRNTRDFSKPEECEIIGKTLQQLEKEQKIRPKVENIPHRILFAEIYMRFSRNYTPKIQDDWSVSFYKINSFDVLNYNAT